MRNIFELCDLVRETGFALHRYLYNGHFEKVYENGLVHRLRKHGLEVHQQLELPVQDEDGTVLGDYCADLLVNKQLIIEVKACKSLVDEHTAQILGYLRAANLEHGLLVNFGAPKFQIRKFALSKAGPEPEA